MADTSVGQAPIHHTRHSGVIAIGRVVQKGGVEMAVDYHADTIVFEANYGGDQALSSSYRWDALRNAEREVERQRILADQPNMTARRLEQLVDRASLRYSRLLPTDTRRRPKNSATGRTDRPAVDGEQDLNSQNTSPRSGRVGDLAVRTTPDSPGRIDATCVFSPGTTPHTAAGSSTRS